EDITERKNAEERLKKTIALLQSIMDSSSEGIIIATDSTGVILIWNEGARRLLGYEPQEVVGKKNIRIFHTKEYLKSGVMKTNIENMITTGKPLMEEITYVAKDGRSFPVWQVVNPRFDEDGEFIGMLGTAHDITERKLAEEAIKKARDELEMRVRERTEELAETNEELRVEREALRQKNIALQEILNQIEAGKRQMASQIQSNVDRIILPILDTLEGKISQSGKHYISLLRNSLTDITSPFIDSLETRFSKLTPREVEICNMVKNGLTCKDIANTLNISVQTVLKQRSIIR
ncbi:unnamed protein product, partial [marine sediment metagenome]